MVTRSGSHGAPQTVFRAIAEPASQHALAISAMILQTIALEPLHRTFPALLDHGAKARLTLAKPLVGTTPLELGLGAPRDQLEDGQDVLVVR